MSLSSYSENIRRIAREDKPKGGLKTVEERPPIPAMVAAPKSKKETDITSPLTVEILTTETVRVYQNNDDTSSNWIDEQRALTFQIVDANDKILLVESITWPDPNGDN